MKKIILTLLLICLGHYIPKVIFFMSSDRTELVIWSIGLALFMSAVLFIGQELNISDMYQSLIIVTYMSTYDFPQLLMSLGLISLVGIVVGGLICTFILIKNHFKF